MKVGINNDKESGSNQISFRTFFGLSAQLQVSSLTTFLVAFLASIF